MSRASRSLAFRETAVVADPASVPMPARTVVVSGERIASVATAARSSPASGFTSVYDLSSLWENTVALRVRIERGVAGPRIFSSADLEAAVRAGVALTPTLTLWQHLLRHDRISTRQSAVDTAVEQLRRWSAQGSTVLFGTDYGAVPARPSREYALMQEGGMAFERILDSLTTAPAERFGEAEVRGRVAAAMAADLVVLEGDPRTNLSALALVRYTVRRGEIVYRG